MDIFQPKHMSDAVSLTPKHKQTLSCHEHPLTALSQFGSPV